MNHNSSIFQQNGLPLYLQFGNFLRRNIESGEWPVGTKIPSLEELAKSFKLSRVTVRQAVQALVADNLLESLQGKGTFVATRPDPKVKIKLQTSWDELIKRIENYEVEIITELDVPTCPPLEGKQYELYAGYHFMKRVHSVSGKPCALLDVYLAKEIYEKDTDKFKQMPILAAIGEMNIKVAKAHQVLTIGCADTEASNFLDIRIDEPIAYVFRVAEDFSGKVFYMANLTYPGNQIYQEINMFP